MMSRSTLLQGAYAAWLSPMRQQGQHGTLGSKAHKALTIEWESV